MTRLLALSAIACVVAACGSSQPQPAKPESHDPVPVLPRPDSAYPTIRTAKTVATARRVIAYALPAFTKPAPTKRVCHIPAATKRLRRHRIKTYDFSDDTIHPLAFGPKVPERSVSAFMRTERDVREALRNRRREFHACYRWVRFRGRAQWRDQPRLRLEFTVDPLGAVTSADVSFRYSQKGTENKDERDFLDCVRDVLTTSRLTRRTSRITRVKATLVFNRSGLGQPRTRPRRPVLPPVELRTKACVSTSAHMATTTLNAGVLATFTDWEQTHADHERTRYRRKYKRYRPRRRVRLPIRLIGSKGCGRNADELDRRTIRALVRSNVGTYRACYRAALARTPNQRGKLMVAFTITPTGEIELKPLGANARTGVDAQLAACITNAIKQTRRPLASDQWIDVTYPFVFDPEPPQPLNNSAEAALELGDGDTAAELFAARIRSSGGGVAECTGRLGVLQAMMIKAPWLHDVRVAAAAKDLANYAGRVPKTAGMTKCLRRAAKLVANIALSPLRHTRTPRPGRMYWSRVDAAGTTEIADKILALLKHWANHPQHVALRRLELHLRANHGDIKGATHIVVNELLPKKLNKQIVVHVLDELARGRKVRRLMDNGKPLSHCGPRIY